MVQVTVHYEGQLRCSVRHEPSEETFVTDAPTDNHGKGESFSPTDLCAAALGSCMGTILGIQMDGLGVDASETRIEMKKEMSKHPPRRIARLATEIWIPVKLETKVRQRIERAVKGCPVHHSLSSEIDKPIIFHWL